MFFDKMIKTLSHNLINIPGWYTKRKLVVIESDGMHFTTVHKQIYE